MSRVPRRVSLVAVGWLLCHVITVGVSLAGLCCDITPDSASVSDEDACCKGLAPGQMCPLHKHGSHQSKGRAPAQIPADGAMRSGCESGAMTLPALGLGVGLMPEIAKVSDLTTASVLDLEATATIARIALPDFPPPRA